MGILKVWVAILINTSLLRVTAYNQPSIGMADIDLQYVFWFSKDMVGTGQLWTKHLEEQVSS